MKVLHEKIEEEVWIDIHLDSLDLVKIEEMMHVQKQIYMNGMFFNIGIYKDIKGEDDGFQDWEEEKEETDKDYF